MQERILIGHIIDLQIFTDPEFGTRASFKIMGAGQRPVTCSVTGNVAREFIPYYREGDVIAVSGFDEPRPSTASADTPWAGRFHIRALLLLESAGVAA